MSSAGVENPVCHLYSRGRWLFAFEAEGAGGEGEYGDPLGPEADTPAEDAPAEDASADEAPVDDSAADDAAADDTAGTDDSSS